LIISAGKHVGVEKGPKILSQRNMKFDNRRQTTHCGTSRPGTLFPTEISLTVVVFRSNS
jgi:hypothetical protein